MSVEHVHALAKGTRLNQYELMKILGTGGFGITYMARDTTLDTLVAIKEYLPSDFAVRQEDSQVTAKSSTSKGDFDWGLTRFLEEARVLAKFRHPNIVHVNQIFEANHTAYLVMEYAKGESLDELLRRVGTLSELQTKDILFPILDGLKRVHEQGFLHRDIKPGNIILREEEGAVLIDFGAARQAVETKSRSITSIVTEGYAPLEQYDSSGHQGPWTDIYALGAVAYKCLTGNKPPAAISRLRTDPLVPLAIAAKGRVSAAFGAAIEAALRVHENERPQTVSEFAAMISGAASPRAQSQDSAATLVLNAAPTEIGRSDPASVRPASARIALSDVASAATSAAPANSIAVTAAPMPGSRKTSPIYLAAAAAIMLAVAGGGWFYSQQTRQVASTETKVEQASNVNAYVPAGTNETPPDASANANASAAPAAPPQTAATKSPPAAAPPPAATAPQQAPQVASVVPEIPPVIEPVLPAPPAIQASFDCTAPSNDAERIVCSDSQLAALDVRMADLYRRGLALVTDQNIFRGEQQEFLAKRDLCADKPCVAAAYDGRIKELQRWVNP